MNKIQQVCSNDNHMSVTGRVEGGLGLCLVSRGQGVGPMSGIRGRLPMPQCIMGNGHMGTP